MARSDDGNIYMLGGFSYGEGIWPTYITSYDEDEDRYTEKREKKMRKKYSNQLIYCTCCRWTEQFDWAQIRQGRTSFAMLSVPEEFLPPC